ncbi:MAG: hypothetical protein LUB83_00070 [Prevotellaceae bacterium]|nr:hypothetical protein [Prevotellaceae bacterium]
MKRGQMIARELAGRLAACLQTEKDVHKAEEKVNACQDQRGYPCTSCLSCFSCVDATKLRELNYRRRKNHKDLFGSLRTYSNDIFDALGAEKEDIAEYTELIYNK